MNYKFFFYCLNALIWIGSRTTGIVTFNGFALLRIYVPLVIAIINAAPVRIRQIRIFGTQLDRSVRLSHFFIGVC